MNEFRVSKYNPKNRDARGRYLVDEWTAISDIGRTYGGDVFTADIYEKVENAYLDTALSLLEEAGIAHMIVEFHPDEICTPKQFKGGDQIEIAAVREVLKSLLREEYWCRLESPNGAFIHAGYDFYMYIGAPPACLNWISLATERGLFVEPCISPYKPDPEDEGNES